MPSSQYESESSPTAVPTTPPLDSPIDDSVSPLARLGSLAPRPTPTPTNDFLALATAQLNRGFKYLTPLHPSTKRPAIKGYNKRAPTTHGDISKWAEKFPDYGVGVVCRRGIGHQLFSTVTVKD